MNRERKILFLVLSLSLFGLVVLYSASAGYVEEGLKRPGEGLFFAEKQALALLLGFVFIFLLSFFPYRRFYASLPYLYADSLVLLLLVWVPGIGMKLNEARRWIGVRSFSFQPSELVKFLLPFFLAWFIVEKRDHLQKGWFVAACVGFVLLPVGLIVLEPDVGTAGFIFLIGLGSLFLGRVCRKELGVALLMGLGVAGFVVAHKVGHVEARIRGYLHPTEFSQSLNYQRQQAMIAVTTGGLGGEGLGNGVQKLFYLPDAFTDFILAVLMEEMGLVGLVLLLVLYGGLLKELYQWVFSFEGAFEFQSGFLLVSLLFFQIVLNIFVVVGLLPTKGIPLPFMSYGGSSLMLMIAFLGLLLKMKEHQQGGGKKEVVADTLYCGSDGGAPDARPGLGSGIQEAGA